MDVEGGIEFIEKAIKKQAEIKKKQLEEFEREQNKANTVRFQKSTPQAEKEYEQMVALE